MTAQEIRDLFVSKKLTLGSIESFTGGRFASTVTSVPGASHFFKGALVTYFTEEKINLLGIPESIVSQYGVVSSEVALEMAKRGKNLLNVDYAIAFTGNAGPEAMENKPVGEIYISIAFSDRIMTYPYLLKGNRDGIQKQAIELGFELLAKMIL